jgi:hypothetical protein
MARMNYHYIRNLYIIITLFFYPFLRRYKLDFLKDFIPVFLSSFYLTVFLFNIKYVGVIYWGLCNIICYKIMIDKKYNVVESFYMSFIGSVAFSWLYEILWFNNIVMFYDESYPLKIHHKTSQYY